MTPVLCSTMARLPRMNLLQSDLKQSPRTINLAGAERHEIIHDTQQPPEMFQPHIEADELRDLYERTTPDAILRPWLIYAGVGTGSDYEKRFFHAKPETAALEGLYHATLRINDQRTAVRYTPNEWEAQASPFTLHAHDSGLAIYHHDQLVAHDPEVLEPEASCLRNISYKSDGRNRDKDQSITANPIQSCPMRCKFCRRQYDEYDEYRKTRKELGLAPAEQLINLKPEELATHLVEKYPNLDWSSDNQIAMVTGTFANFDHMHGYIDKFVGAMEVATNNAFSPRTQPLQNIHILTHLARTPDQMQALKELGVKTVQDTAEIIDDARRQEVMPKANPKNTRLLGKGEVSFDEILEGVSSGIEVFGENNYFVTVILGLDDYETTQRGLRQLKEAGLRHLDAPIYQPFQLSGVALYQMAVRNLIDASLQAKEDFDIVSTTWNPQSLAQVAARR